MNAPKTRFTNHVNFRVLDSDDEERRPKISAEQIAELLDGDKAIPVAHEDNKIHRAFYSELDDKVFVAVQDPETGDVITIQPISFYYRKKMVLDMEQVFALAKNRYYGREESPPKKPQFVAGPNTYCHINITISGANGSTGSIRLERLPRFKIPEGSLLPEVLTRYLVRENIQKEVAKVLPIGYGILKYGVTFTRGFWQSDEMFFNNRWIPCS